MQSGDWRSRPHKPHCHKQFLGRQDQSGVSESISFSLLQKKKKKKKRKEKHIS
jgi:hypothetical protein